MAENEEIINRLIFDIGDSGQAFEELSRILKQYNSNIDSIIAVTEKYNEKTGATDFVIKAFTDNLRKLSFSLESTEKGYQGVNIAAEDNLRIQKQASEFIQAKNDAIQEAAELEQQFATALANSNLQREREAALTKEAAQMQAILDKELAKANAEEERYQENLARSKAREFVQTQKELAEAYKFVAKFTRDAALAQAEHNKELQEARDLNRRQFEAASAADFVGQNVFSNLRTHPQATVEEINNQALAISRFARFVEEGQIGAKRAFEIFQSISKGTGEIFSKSETQVAQAAQGILNANSRLGESYALQQKQLKLVGEEGERSAFKITISWESLARFFATHIIYSQFNKLISAFREGTQTGIKLSLQIAEIQTISQRAQLSTAQWTNEIRKLSDEFDRPISDVTEATYETLSNQIAKGADSTKFLREALLFAQTTVSSTEDAVNLLSSAINAYNIPAERAGEISATFFKIIDLGRVRASEMANTFGRVGQLSASLGISLEETGAAITTLTREGIKYNEAFTLINNIATKLLKPTVPLLKIFQEWGVANGEAAIATFGFAGTLQKLEQAANGSDSELANIFKDIRAIRGVLGLTGSAFKNFTRDLNEIKGASNEYSKAIDLIQQSTGFQLEKQINEVKNLFATDIGQSFAETILSVTKSVGTLRENVERFLEVAKIGIEVFLLYKGATLSAKLATDLYNTTLGVYNLSLRKATVATTQQTAANKEFIASLKPNLILISIAAIVTLFETLSSKEKEIAEAGRKAFEQLQEQSAKQIDIENQRRDRDAKNFKDNLDQKYSYILQFNAKVLRENDTIVEQIKDSYTNISNNLKNALDSAYDSSRQVYNQAKRDIESAKNEIKKTQKEIANLQSDFESKQFKINLDNASPIQQIELLKGRLTDLSNKIIEARKNINAANVDEQKQIIEKYFNEQVNIQEELGERQRRLIKEIGDLQAQQNVRNREQTRRYTLDQQRDELAKLRLKEASNKLTAQEAEKLRELRTEIANANEADKNTDIAKKLSDKQSELGAINAIVTSNQNLATAYQDQAKFLQQIIDLENQKLKNEQDAAKNAESTFQKQKDAITSIVKFDLTDKTTGKLRFDSLKDALAEFQGFQKEAFKAGLKSPELVRDFAQQELAITSKFNALKNQQDLKSTQDRLIAEKEAIVRQRDAIDQDLRKRYQKQFELTDKIFADITQLQADSTKSLFNARFSSFLPEGTFSTLKQAVDQYKKSNDPKDLKAVIDQVNILRSTLAEGIKKESSGGALFGLGKGDGEIVTVRELLNRIQLNAIAIGKNRPGIAKDTQELTNINAQINQLTIAFENLDKSQKSLFNDIKEEIPKTVGQLIQDTTELIKKIEELRLKANPLSHPTTNPISFNNNPDGSFRTSLTTTNNRITNSTKTGNVTIGDINVTVASSGNVKVDAVEIGKEIRNEIRLGRLNWNV